MKSKFKVLLPIAIAVLVLIGSGIWLSKQYFPVLHPSGQIAKEQLQLIIFSASIMAIVVIPVFVMLGVILWRYRAGNNKRVKYQPDWDHNRTIEAIWWGVPILIILILGVITWVSSHKLDPYRSIAKTNQKELTIQVISLDWKWLFIYPEQKVASVNLMPMPVNTPISLHITSDAPMNSFWLPALAGQIYSMTGMTTKLHINADKTGNYVGRSANISGEGFADMHFTAQVETRAEFDAWVSKAQSGPDQLDFTRYKQIAKPSVVKDPMSFVLSDQNIYDKVLLKYTGMNHEGH